MALKETEGSLRAYLIFAGAVSILLGLRDTSDLKDLEGVALPLDWTLAVYVPLISDFVLGAAFIAAGIRLKAELPRGAGWIKTMLVASGVMLFINGALIVSVFGTEIGRSGIGHALIGLAITIYLHRSVVRLAKEAAARDGIPPPPPTAKVV
ncbi:MAG TPA: hypothetical protein VIV11_23890 [Kofleriaceae bacterium]